MGGRLYEALRGGRFVLITPADTTTSPDAARKDRLAVASWASGRRTALLVRPDGYAAWAAESANAQVIEAALAAAVGQG